MNGSVSFQSFGLQAWLYAGINWDGLQIHSQASPEPQESESSVCWSVLVNLAQTEVTYGEGTSVVEFNLLDWPVGTPVWHFLD